MKKIVFCILSMVTTCAFAGENSSFSYGGVQTMGGLPMVGLGVRAKTGTHCMDFSGNLCPLNIRFNEPFPAIFHIKGQYLFYPVKEGLYFGGGLGVLNEPESLVNIGGSFEGTLGYQWKVSRNVPMFLEANGIVPFEKPQGTQRVWPGISIGIGF